MRTLDRSEVRQVVLCCFSFQHKFYLIIDIFDTLVGYRMEAVGGTNRRGSVFLLLSKTKLVYGNKGIETWQYNSLLVLRLPQDIECSPKFIHLAEKIATIVSVFQIADLPGLHSCLVVVLFRSPEFYVGKMIFFLFCGSQGLRTLTFLWSLVKHQVQPFK